MVTHTPTWQDSAPMPIKQSWDILPNFARMIGQPSPNCPDPCCFQHCLPLPLVLQMCHPIKSSSWFTPSAGCTQMTLAAFQSGRARGTNTSWSPAMPMAISSSRKHLSPKVTPIALQPTMPLWHAWQPGVFQLTSRFLTVTPAWHYHHLSWAVSTVLMMCVWWTRYRSTIVCARW